MSGSLVFSAAMEEALRQARQAAELGEVPVGAVIMDETGQIIARAHNRVESMFDASAHAELLAMRQAATLLGKARLISCSLVVSLEPCPMCAAAISHFRLKRVIFGAYDLKGGGVEHGPRLFAQKSCLHRPEEIIGGMREDESAALLRQFFRARRQKQDLE